MNVDDERRPVVIVGGGQSGLVAARTVRQHGLRPLVLEAQDRPAGSWPRYYDSLRLFSPAGFNSLPGLPFPGDPERYPHRDEVVAYLEQYADRLAVEIRTRARVTAVTAQDEGGGFLVETADGQQIDAAGVVATSGAFDTPHLPDLPGQEDFAGQIQHVANYRHPSEHAGKKVVVVGAGNSAVQVGHELTSVADVTFATRQPLRFFPQHIDGRDLHHWLRDTGLDHVPAEWLAHFVTRTLVIDSGGYQQAAAAGSLRRRVMFEALDDDGVVWGDGTREHVDVVLLATGYRPNLAYLRPLGALDTDGAPLHVAGISTTHPGLVYLGLEFQRCFASNTLRGVGHDANHVVPALAAHARGHLATLGN